MKNVEVLICAYSRCAVFDFVVITNFLVQGYASFKISRECLICILRCRGKDYITSRNVISPVVLSGCLTWSLSLKDEYRLRVFMNEVQQKILGQRGKK